MMVKPKTRTYFNPTWQLFVPIFGAQSAGKNIKAFGIQLENFLCHAIAW